MNQLSPLRERFRALISLGQALWAACGYVAQIVLYPLYALYRAHRAVAWYASHEASFSDWVAQRQAQAIRAYWRGNLLQLAAALLCMSTLRLQYGISTIWDVLETEPAVLLVGGYSVLLATASIWGIIDSWRR